MNFLDAADAPIPVKIGDKTHQIPRLTLNQAATLLAKWSIEKRGELVARIKDSGITGKDAFDMLDRFDRMARHMSTGMVWCSEIDKIKDTIEAAAGKALADAYPITEASGYLSMVLWGADEKKLGQEVSKGEGESQGQSATG